MGAAAALSLQLRDPGRSPIVRSGFQTGTAAALFLSPDYSCSADTVSGWPSMCRAASTAPRAASCSTAGRLRVSQQRCHPADQVCCHPQVCPHAAHLHCCIACSMLVPRSALLTRVHGSSRRNLCSTTRPIHDQLSWQHCSRAAVQQDKTVLLAAMQYYQQWYKVLSQ